MRAFFEGEGREEERLSQRGGVSNEVSGQLNRRSITSKTKTTGGALVRIEGSMSKMILKNHEVIIKKLQSIRKKERLVFSLKF